jgi:hypothetical protein
MCRRFCTVLNSLLEEQCCEDLGLDVRPALGTTWLAVKLSGAATFFALHTPAGFASATVFETKRITIVAG